MSTAIMGIPPEETEAFKTDIGYRLSVAEAMNEVLEHEGVDEVILTYSADGQDTESVGDVDFAMNPGTVADFLRGQGVTEDVIDYVLSFEDSKVHGKLANLIRRSIKEEGRAMSLEELKKHGEPLRPKELTPLEVALYAAVKDEKNLTAWLGREIRLIKKEYGSEIDNTDVVEFLYPLQSIKDWYVGNDRPSGMERLSFKDAYNLAVEWEKAMAGKGEGLYYGPVDPKNILFLDSKTGFTVQEIRTENDLKVEGNRMHHCVGSYFGYIEEGRTRIVSLRDPGNRPHITIQLDRYHIKDGDEWRVYQIKGFANQVPKPEYREILKRYFATIQGLRYANQDKTYSRTLGFRSLAIESAVGKNRWSYDPNSQDHDRPSDLTDEETAAIIVEHAKNITAVLKHSQRYWRLKKGESGLRFEERTVGLDIKTQKPDEYGIVLVTEKREETKVSAAIFGGDLRVFLGDVWLDKDQDVPLTPVLKEAIDIFIEAVVETDKIERKLRGQWKKAVNEFLKGRKAVLAELRKIGPERFGPQHFKQGVFKAFYDEQKRSEHMPYPSYANQVYLVERDIKRAEESHQHWQSVSEKIVSIAPFSLDSLSECAQEMLGSRDATLTEQFPRGKWSPEKALQYFSLTLFERINGCSMFAD